MPAPRRPGKRAYLLIAGFALLLVLFPFLFWYSAWFGRPLSDADLDRYFADAAHPRRAQHALVQLGERMARRRDISRWYRDVLRQAERPNLELRQTAAWIMGQDRAYPPFHDALLRLVRDPEPMVRRNAALALAAFGDRAGRAELAAMLRPYTVVAPADGVVRRRVKAGEFVNPGTTIAHVGAAEARSAVPGEVRSLDRPDGASVRAGDPLAELAPDKGHVWEALRALFLVGTPEDLVDVERFTSAAPGRAPEVARQASLTAEAIRQRAVR